MQQEYDYIIIGSGSAGSVVANRLSADPANRVLVIEAGGRDRNYWLRLPVGYFRTIYDTRFSRVFDTEPSEGSGGRNVVWPRGRIVGGSSSINGLIFIRGQKDDFNDWQQLGAVGWSYDDVLPHFRKLESFPGGEDALHGRTGELTVSDLRNQNQACAMWLKAAQQYGLPFNPDFNGATTYGVGSYQLSLGSRWRASAATSFLHPALKRSNLDLMTNAHVTRVLIEHDRATGVEYLVGRDTHSLRATREVILAAGAIQSPQILQLSGIGPAEHLQSLGIKVLQDSPEVGENLQDHYQMRLIVQLNRKLSLNDDVRNPLKLAKMGADWLFAGKGALTVGAGQVGGGACTRYATGGRPDMVTPTMSASGSTRPSSRSNGHLLSAKVRPTASI